MQENVSCQQLGHIAMRVAVWQDRPYNDDSTASRLLSEVKHHLARLVLRWGTTLESLVLFFYLCRDIWATCIDDEAQLVMGFAGFVSFMQVDE